MTDFTLTFIGGGNMAASLIGGLIADGWSPDCIRVADPDANRLTSLAQRFPIRTSADNLELIPGADAVVRVEDTESVDDSVRILVGVEGGTNVRPAGEDVRAGEVALPAGRRPCGPEAAAPCR